MEKPEHPIFMSYAWDDDIVPRVSDETLGWISHFKEYVSAGLKLEGIKDLELWRDINSYSENQEFEPQIKRALSNSVILIAIVSPNFLQSEWCPLELSLFKEHINQRRGKFDREWIVKILKNPIAENSLEDYLGGRSGFQFYHEPGPGQVEPFYHVGGLMETHKQAYRDTTVKVIRELKRLWELWLKETGRTANNTNTFSESSRKRGTVYVARPAADGREHYLKLIGEVQARDYAVVPDPDATIPEWGPDAETFFRTALKSSSLAVHVVTRTGGMRPENGDSIARMQLRLASERARMIPSFRRIIWLPRGIGSNDPEHQNLIDNLRTGHDAHVRLHANDERVETDDFEQFRDEVINILRTPDTGKVESAHDDPEVRMIYALCAPEDDNTIFETLEPLLYDRGYDVMLPLRKGSEDEKQREHQRCITTSDRILVVWGEGSEAWIRQSLAELEALKASRRSLLVKLSPFTQEKKRFRRRGLRGDLDTSVSSLQTCIDEHFASLGGGR